MTLELVKIEEGLMSGSVVYHQYVKKTTREIDEMNAKFKLLHKQKREEEAKLKAKEERRAERLKIQHEKSLEGQKKKLEKEHPKSKDDNEKSEDSENEEKSDDSEIKTGKREIPEKSHKNKPKVKIAKKYENEEENSESDSEKNNDIFEEEDD